MWNLSCWGCLRPYCYIIGYLNLLAVVVDIMVHVVVAAVVSDGFQCDVTNNSLNLVRAPWLQPLLIVVNIGTHGFYPSPLTIAARDHVHYGPIAVEPRCYPGMLHLYLLDILNLLINVIWLKFVVSFLSALRKKDPEPMRLFFGLGLVKLSLQIIYFIYQPAPVVNVESECHWVVKIMDIWMSTIYLVLIHSYIAQVRRELAAKRERPLPYIERLIARPQDMSREESSQEVALSYITMLEDEALTEKKLPTFSL